MMIYFPDESAEWINETDEESILRVVEKRCGSEIFRLVKEFMVYKNEDCDDAGWKYLIQQWINVLGTLRVDDRDEEIFRGILKEMKEEVEQ